jgi:hypothetical protein
MGDQLEFVEMAFVSRARPELVRDMSRPPDDASGDADAFAGMDWRDVTCAMLDKRFGAVTCAMLASRSAAPLPTKATSPTLTEG